MAVFCLSQPIALVATAGERGSQASTALDRVSFAVDGAESSHGENSAMWRPDPSGPQGPMQVTEAAATDVGGGDRFDSVQNRAIGRAYLAQLYWRYRNWPDAITAYNWGIGNLDAWVKEGRPAEKLLVGVAVYLRRVLHDSGFCDVPTVGRAQQRSTKALPARQNSPVATKEREAETSPAAAEDSVARAACLALDVEGPFDGRDRHWSGIGPSRFYAKLDKAMALTAQHLSGREVSRVAFGNMSLR